MNQHQLVLMGRATRDAEVLESKAGKEYSKFAIAVNEYRGKIKGGVTSFYEIVGFTAQTKNACRNIHKGDMVFVTGRPEVQAYKALDGELRAKLSVNAEYICGYNKPKEEQIEII